MKYDNSNLLIALSKTKEADKNICRLFLYFISKMYEDKSREETKGSGFYFEQPGEAERELNISSEEYNNSVNFLIEHGLLVKSCNDTDNKAFWTQESSSKWSLSGLKSNIKTIDEESDTILTLDGIDSLDEISEKILSQQKNKE